ncbi:hypothetical protein BGX28_007896 [Mortierella sp. GBA30]|nr:hypothetical protein BGX28_007896 [Mortierella sp. GBA30]
MAHLIDPCLRATKIAHGIRRGIDGLSPLSGLVPELRILIQEQKNVLTSLKRTAFEKEEAAKHLAIYAKTEGPDISDTLSKLSLLIQKAADLERDYATSLAQSREFFKEIRVAEDENYSVRKRKLDLEQKLSIDKSHHYHIYQSSSPSSSTASLPRGPELHPEMKLLRQETTQVENELEDLKRKRIKKATSQQLDALEKLGKELIVVAHYGREIMDQLDDAPTPAGTHADDHYGSYDGAARTAYAVKACLDTFKSWSEHTPKVQVTEIDMGDFPKDTKQAVDAMLQDLAIKSGSDWYSLQSPSASSSPGRNRTSSVTSSTGTASPRNSMSSTVTTMTYVDGVPTVKAINEIPPTPELEDGPTTNVSTGTAASASASASNASAPTQEPVPLFVAPSSTATAAMMTTEALSEENIVAVAPTAAAAYAETVEPLTMAATGHPSSPFVPQTTYTPATTYHAGQGHSSVDGRKSASPPARTRPLSGEHFVPTHAPHPLMMQTSPLQHPQKQQQHLQASYPPGPAGGGGSLPMQIPMPMTMPMPMPMPMQMQMQMLRPTYNMPIIPMSMPVPHIPGSPDPQSGSGNKRHSQPISVSFPVRPSPSPSVSPVPAMESSSILSSAAQSQSQSRAQEPHRRNPHAVLPPTEPGFRIPVGVTEDDDVDNIHDSAADNVYDGPPPDYAEAAMQIPAEKREEKDRHRKRL